VALRRNVGTRPQMASVTHCSAASFISDLLVDEPSMTLTSH
jgi:hypothetical protein